MPQNDQMRAFFEAHGTAELKAIWLAKDCTAWSDEAFIVVEDILRARGEPLEASENPIAMPASAPCGPDGRSGGGIRAMVRGELSLPVTYWQYSVLPAIVFQLAARGFGLSPIVLAVSVCWLIYLPFALIGLWRSAGHYRGPRAWAVLARVNVAVVVLMIAATFAMFINSIMDR
jgi:hypothetical protein